MKKLFALVAVAAAMCFGACTEKIDESLDFSKASADEVVSALSEKLQTGDATVISKALETVQTQLSKLMEGTDVAKVTEYATKIKAFVEENAETLKGFNIDVAPLTAVIDKVAALPGAAVDEATDAAEGAVEDAQEKAENAADAAIEEAEAKVDAAVEAAEKAVDEAIETGKTKTNEAIQNAADKIKL